MEIKYERTPVGFIQTREQDGKKYYCLYQIMKGIGIIPSTIRSGDYKHIRAKESGLSREMIAKLELGRHSPTLETATKICRSLAIEFVINPTTEFKNIEAR